MAPFEIKKETVKSLGLVRTAMMELEYLIELKKLPLAKQKRAALQLSDVQIAYLQLRKSVLADIRDRLIANEGDLIKGMDSIDKALGNLKKIEKMMQVVDGFLKLVAKVISI
ncbi:MAG: hypothetical protein ACR2MX_11885 [Cyclobacteriaceae bacterium]